MNHYNIIINDEGFILRETSTENEKQNSRTNYILLASQFPELIDDISKILGFKHTVVRLIANSIQKENYADAAASMKLIGADISADDIKNFVQSKKLKLDMLENFAISYPEIIQKYDNLITLLIDNNRKVPREALKQVIRKETTFFDKFIKNFEKLKDHEIVLFPQEYLPIAYRILKIKYGADIWIKLSKIISKENAQNILLLALLDQSSAAVTMLTLNEEKLKEYLPEHYKPILDAITLQSLSDLKYEQIKEFIDSLDPVFLAYVLAKFGYPWIPVNKVINEIEKLPKILLPKIAQNLDDTSLRTLIKKLIDENDFIGLVMSTSTKRAVQVLENIITSETINEKSMDTIVAILALYKKLYLLPEEIFQAITLEYPLNILNYYDKKQLSPKIKMTLAYALLKNYGSSKIRDIAYGLIKDAIKEMPTDKTIISYLIEMMLDYSDIITRFLTYGSTITAAAIYCLAKKTYNFKEFKEILKEKHKNYGIPMDVKALLKAYKKTNNIIEALKSMGVNVDPLKVDRTAALKHLKKLTLSELPTNVLKYNMTIELTDTTQIYELIITLERIFDNKTQLYIALYTKELLHLLPHEIINHLKSLNAQSMLINLFVSSFNHHSEIHRNYLLITLSLILNIQTTLNLEENIFHLIDNNIASGSSDNTVRIWDAESGKLIKTLEGHTSSVNSVAWSPDGKYIASGSSDNTVRIWDAESGVLIKTLAGHTGAVYSVAWSPDGMYIVSGSYNKAVRVWDAWSGKLIKTLAGHTSSVNSVAWSPIFISK